MSVRNSIQQFISASEPSGAALGDEWFDPSSSKLYKRTISNGVVSWVSVKTSISTVQPSNPITGDLWYDGSALYVYNNSTWSSTTASTATSITLGTVYARTSSSCYNISVGYCSEIGRAHV